MKKTIYIVSWVFLGLILSFIVHAKIEMQYLKWADTNNIIIQWSLGGNCALPLWLIILLPVLGIALGVWAGFFFWQKVYVEHILKKFKK